MTESLKKLPWEKMLPRLKNFKKGVEDDFRIRRCFESMKSISNLKVNEAFQMKAYTKLMENLNVAEKANLSFTSVENIGEIQVLNDQNGGDIVFANGGSSGIICYYFQEKTAALSNVTVPLRGSNMVAGIDKNGLVYVFVIRNNCVFYSKENTLHSMDFGEEEQLDVTLPKDFKSIERLLIQSIDEGFALFVVSSGKDEKTDYLTCLISGDIYDYMLPIAFGKGEFTLSGANREELTVHLISDNYVKYNMNKRSLETFKLDIPAGVRVKQICYAEKLYCLCSDSTIGIVKCNEDSAAIIKIMYNASGDAFAVKKFGQYFHTVILGENIFHAKIQLDGIYSATSPCPIDLAVSDAHFSPREDALTLFYFNKEEHVIVRLDYSDDDGNWSEMTFEAIQPGEVRRKPCYSTEIHFLHPEYGTPLNNIDVEIWTEERTYLETELGLRLTDKDNKIKLNTGFTGKIYFLQYTDKVDSVPVLAKLPENLMSADENLLFRQYEVTTGNFKGIKDDDILNAKTTDSMGTDQQDLLKGDFRTKENAEALANGINDLMELHGQINTCSTCKGAYIVKAHEIPKLNLVQVRDDLPAWSLTAENGKLVYKKLTESEAALEIAMMKDGARVIDGFFSSIGDFFRAIGKKIAEVVKVVVKGVETVVTCVINGVKTVFTAIIKTISEVLEFIETVFAAVLIFFVAIFAWLAALFQWADVKRTQKALIGCIQIFLEKMPERADKLCSDLSAYLSELKTDLSSVIDEICEKIAPDESLMKFAKENTPQNPKMEEGYSNDVLMRRLMSDDISFVSLSYGEEMALYKEQVSDIMDVIVEFTENISNSEAFAQAGDYFEKAFKNIDGFFTNTFAALLKVVEGLVSLTLEGLGAVLKAVFDAVKTLLDCLKAVFNKEIRVPFFSELYQFMTGDTLTLMNLASFVMAVPVTIIYKIIGGKAPFDNEGEVHDFTAHIEDAFISENTQREQASDDMVGVSSIIATIFGTVYYGVTAGLDYEECIKPPTPPEPEDLEKIPDWVALLLELGWFVMSNPWIYKESEKPITTMEYFQWGFFGAGCLIDTTFLVYLGEHVDKAGKGGRIVTSIYGFLHIIVAAAANLKDGFDVLLIPEYVGGVTELSKFLINLDTKKTWSRYPVPGLDVIELLTILVCGIIDVAEEE